MSGQEVLRKRINSLEAKSYILIVSFLALLGSLYVYIYILNFLCLSMLAEK